MGTNYYLHEDACSCCGRSDPDDVLHIGKSSSGWCFALHVIPDEGINGLTDWERRWSAENARIRDEYGADVTPAQMRSWVAERRRRIEGRALRRSEIDGRHCIGHGEGTWDLIAGEFS